MADINVEQVLKRLTLSEKIDLLAGIDFWHTKSLPRHGVPSLRLTDGPNGVRGTKFFNSVPAACFPCGTALGSTFNLPLLEEAGRKMGEEAIAKSAHVILGPTINIQRSPLGGRGFESISEDPMLSGLGASALIKGIQSTGVQATIKHFVCNDGEDKRLGVHAILTDRALREIYALPFQIVVRDGKPGAVMTAYNGINGTYLCDSPYIKDMLRGEWGWDGLVMSDWFAVYSTNPSILAGLDLEMPGPTKFRGEALKFNVSTGKPYMHVIDERAREVLKFVKKCAASGVEEDGPEGSADTPETAALLRRIGDESIVLMKNEDNVLPLKKDKKTLVLGPNAKVATYHGGGSASLSAYYAITPFDGINAKLETAAEYTVGAYTHRFLPLLGNQCVDGAGEPGMSWRVYNEAPGDQSRECIDELRFTKTEMHLVDYTNPKITQALWHADLEGSMVAEEDCIFEVGVLVCGTAKMYCNGELVVDNATKQVKGDAFFGSATREERGKVAMKKGEKYTFKVEFASAPSFTLKDEGFAPGHGALRVGGCKVIDDQEEISKSVALAKEADQVIICAGLNADWETEGADRASMKLPGVLDQLISEVAKANPNTAVVMQTGTPEEMPWIDETKAVIQAWYGGNETGNCIADVLFGDYNPSGKLSLSFPKKLQDVPSFLNFRAEALRTLYGEDVYVGYRYYEFADKEVNFPFGHGLSYTTFSFSDLSTSTKDGTLSTSLNITNTGSVKGAEVAQLYVQPKQMAKINRPVKELKGFAKAELAPGESKTVVIEEDEKYLAAYWDEERSQWCCEAGEYEVILSDSSVVSEKAVKGCFTVEETYWWSGV